MILVDVHAHLDSKFYGRDIEEVIERAKSAGVKAIVSCGVDRETNREVLRLSERFPLIRPSLGIYPPDVLPKETRIARDWDIDEEIGFIDRSIRKAIAVGEIGLDFSDSSEDERRIQIMTLEKLAMLAKRHDKPISVHSRKAEEETIEVLERVNHWKTVMHCFSGNHRLVERIRKNKWFFSIPANIVRSEHFQKVVRETPLCQILTETDSPFLSPYKDKKNEPAFITETIKKMAEIKRITEEDVANQIFMNFQKLYL